MGAKSKLLPFSEKSQVRLERAPFKKLIYTSLVLNIVTIALVLLVKNRLPPEVPLFYGRPIGGEQLGTSISLTIPGLVSLFIVLMNLGIATFLEDDFLRKTLILAGVASVFFSTITTFKIVFLVGSF